MPLSAALSGLCPRPDEVEPPGCDLVLTARGGVRIRCHARLLRARCAALPSSHGGEVDVREERAGVVYALLRWAYCETVDERLRGLDASCCPEVQAAKRADRASLVRLAWRWGLRDASCLQERVANGKCLFRRDGTLAADLLRAYDAGDFGDQSVLFVLGEDSSGDIPLCAARKRPKVLPGGWRELLRRRSAYFGAMLCGSWAEGTGEGSAVRVRWDPKQLARLLRFLHGGPLVDGPEHLMAAAECAQFFATPDALAACTDWVAANLRPTTAPALWTFLEGLPCGHEEDREAWVDADEACFAYHIKHFDELSRGATDHAVGRSEDAPIFNLSVGLFRRLLASGLVEMPTEPLLGIVKKFARMKEKAGHGTALGPGGLCTSLWDSLRPPAVLFNREHRSCLLPAMSELTARMLA